MPLTYLCFSVFMLNKISLFTFLMHTVIFGSYIAFYKEDFLNILGLSDSLGDLPMFAGETGSSAHSSLRNKSLLKDFFQTCWENEDSRKILIFFSINLAFMFVELVFGFISNSLGLITDSFHMLFDCTALFISLCASYISKWSADKNYTYGYVKVEVLSGLFNGIFLVFIAFNVFCESIERMFEPQHIESGGLLLVSVAGLLVNIVGLVFFHDHHDHGHDHGHGHAHGHGHDHGHKHDHKHSDGKLEEKGHSHHHHHHDHENENMYGVFLHVLADALGSVGVIFSSFLVKYYDIYIADPICSFIISLMILGSVVPLI